MNEFIQLEIQIAEAERDVMILEKRLIKAQLIVLELKNELAEKKEKK